MNEFIQDTKAVLLVGGLGTRLQSILPSTPKPLARVGNRPFLELLIRQLRHQGIRRLVLCTGHLAHQVEKEFGDGRIWDMKIEYSKEPSPLGTAGAVKFAEPFLKEDSDFLVLNGDSFMEIDFQQLLHFHRTSGGIASMAVLRMRNEMRYGTVQTTPQGRVIGFREKADSDPAGFVNAGIYVFNQKVFQHIMAGRVSLETDIFPKLLDYGVYASEQHGVFIDIGTPQDYRRARELWDRLYAAASRKCFPSTPD